MSRRSARGERESVQALIGVIAAITAIVVLAGITGGLVWSRGVRRAHAGPSTSVSASASATNAPAKPMTIAPPIVATAAASGSNVNAPVVVPAAAPLVTIGPGTRVLVFGDSFVDAGLSQQMKKLVEAVGGKVQASAWTSSTTIAWASGDKLNNLVAGFKPDVVFISIGANEVFLPAPESRAQFVRSIIKRLDKRPCVWIGTPLWKGETGITAVEKANAAPCTYFDSNAITIDRGTDKIHPSAKGGAAWADAVFAATVSLAAKSP